MREGDGYAIKDAPAGVPRKSWKKLINAALFVRGPMRRFPKGLNRRNMGGLTVAAAVDLVRQTHPDIVHCFERGLGYELQSHESNILVEILKRCPHALPLHDAIQVPTSEAQAARDVMEDVFEYYAERVLDYRSPARITGKFPLLNRVASKYLGPVELEIPFSAPLSITGGGGGKRRAMDIGNGVALKPKGTTSKWFRNLLPPGCTAEVPTIQSIHFKPPTDHQARARRGEILTVVFDEVELKAGAEGAADYQRLSVTLNMQTLPTGKQSLKAHLAYNAQCPPDHAERHRYLSGVGTAVSRSDRSKARAAF